MSWRSGLTLAAIVCTRVGLGGCNDDLAAPAGTPSSVHAGVSLDLLSAQVRFPDGYSECEQIELLSGVVQRSVCKSDPVAGQDVNFLVVDMPPDADQPYDFDAVSIDDVARQIEADRRVLNDAAEVDVVITEQAGVKGVLAVVSADQGDRFEYFYPLLTGGLVWIVSSASLDFVTKGEHEEIFNRVLRSIVPK